MSYYNSQADTFKEYYHSKDIRVRNKLVESNINLAKKEVHKLGVAVKARHSLDDLLQEANLGLIIAVERFNPYKGAMFSSFAIPYIKGKLLQYNRDKGNLIRLPQSVQNLVCKFNKQQPKETTEKTREALHGVLCASNVMYLDFQGRLETSSSTRDICKQYHHVNL